MDPDRHSGREQHQQVPDADGGLHPQVRALDREGAQIERGVTEPEPEGAIGRATGDHPGAVAGAAVERTSAEVEETHRTPVEVVVVGDCPVDEHLIALVHAAREAMVNAAKHPGAGQVQVYAEVELTWLTVFIRDRGSGFDVAAVPGDRYGLAQSVVGRMHRHGGTALVRSTPGEGSEVRLALPRG